MSKAFKCDRCTAYEDDEPVACVTMATPKADNPASKHRKDYELCAKCLASLADWLDAYKRDAGGFGKTTAGGAP